MNWNEAENVQINKPKGAFVFHTPSKPGDESDDSYQTIDEDEDDDEYEPLSITGWGDTAPKEEEPANWDSLIDSSIKVKAGGVGSGNLHRRGGNFRPLSEEYILAQRLNKPIPGKKSGATKSRGGKKKKASAPVASRPPVKHSTRPPSRPTAFARKAPPAPYVPPERERPANAPLSTWSQAALVETPFWESQKPNAPLSQPVSTTHATATVTANSVPVSTAPPASSYPVLCETPFWETAKKPMEPTITTETKPVENQPNLLQPTTTPTTTPTTASKWNVGVPGFQPSPKKAFNPGVPAFNPKATARSIPTTPTFNPNIPSFHPTSTTASQSSSSTTSSSTAKTVFNTNVPEFLPFVQLATPKPVKISPAITEEETPNRNTRLTRTANPLLLKQLQNINSGLSNQPKSTNKVTSVTEGIDNLTMESQTGPESTRGLEEPQPLLQINLELAPGISTELLVYPDSKPEDLVEVFASKHKLNVTNTAKTNLANTIKLLITNKKEALGL